MNQSDEVQPTYSLRTVPIDAIVTWEEAQARTLDTSDIDSLVKSIQSEGLQHPLTVQKDGRQYKLMAGQRRLEALRRLGHTMIPVLILGKEKPQDISDAKAVSVIENIHRKNMSAKDIATSCQFLVDKLGKKNAAKVMGINSDRLREYLGFGAVPDAIKAMVPKKLSRRDAIRICKVIQQEEQAIHIINKISKYTAAQKARYIQALEKLGSSAEQSDITKLANSFRARQNLALRMTKSQAKGLAKLSRESDMEPAEMAQKIVTDYLSRRGIKK